MAEEFQFALQRIYLKDVSFETPKGPEVFTQKWQPQIRVDVNTASHLLEDANFEVILSVTVTAEQEDETLLLIEVKQAGIFYCKGFSDEQLQQILATRAPEILFPYLRETIDSLAVRGSFPAFLLAPINFDALYQQALAENQPKH